MMPSDWSIGQIIARLHLIRVLTIIGAVFLIGVKSSTVRLSHIIGLAWSDFKFLANTFGGANSFSFFFQRLVDNVACVGYIESVLVFDHVPLASMVTVLPSRRSVSRLRSFPRPSGSSPSWLSLSSRTTSLERSQNDSGSRCSRLICHKS